jgi:5-methyltetrahydropteroyltriglutamate--homocysteine methyltransferase
MPGGSQRIRTARVGSPPRSPALIDTDARPAGGESVALPEGRSIAPGFVSHATNVIEHPQLVADRIVRFAQLVGRENVIASTDCGLGGRVHPQIAWAKLEALSAGAALASEQLWP